MGIEDCIFCKIADNRIPAERLYEDELCIAFKDLEPQAPTHILVIPRQHIAMLGRLLLTAAHVARELGFADDGYRVVINTNSDGGQTVFHLHVHLLAGRQFVFPPG